MLGKKRIRTHTHVHTLTHTTHRCVWVPVSTNVRLSSLYWATGGRGRQRQEAGLIQGCVTSVLGQSPGAGGLDGARTNHRENMERRWVREGGGNRVVQGLKVLMWSKNGHSTHILRGPWPVCDTASSPAPLQVFTITGAEIKELTQGVGWNLPPRSPAPPKMRQALNWGHTGVKLGSEGELGPGGLVEWLDKAWTYWGFLLNLWAMEWKYQKGDLPVILTPALEKADCFP